MSIASINIQTAKSTSKAHMSRDKNHKITYLLDPDSKGNEYKSFSNSEKYLNAAKLAAKKITGRKMQQKAIDNFVQEAVLNLEDFHSVDDVEKVFIELKKEFGGFKIFDIAIHRDEGYFYNFKEDLEYRPNRDIFFNDQDKNFYLDSKLKNQADLNQFEKRYNYHAHVLFSKFDMTTGKNPRLKKSDMSKIQTITAKALGMQRGELWSKAKRMSHWQLKAGYDKKRNEKINSQKKSLARQKELKREIGILRDELKEKNALRADYAQLEQLNKELKERIKQKDLTIEELEKSVGELLSVFESEDKEFIEKDEKNALKAVYDKIKHQNEESEPFESYRLEQKAEKEANYASADIFKKLYQTKGIKGERAEKINWFQEEIFPTVSFDVHDLEELYSELKNHDERRTDNFQKAMTLFRRVENSLELILNFVKKKFFPEENKIQKIDKKENNFKRGFRR